MFSLAERLGMTVSEVMERMTAEEFILWTGYTAWAAKQVAEQNRRGR